MKKIYLLWIPVLCLLWRCNENDHMTWKSKGGVYFEDYSQEADSLQYSFRITGLERDTLQLTVKLQGALLDRPMNFRVVTEEGSTAQAGVHYEALKDNYEIEVRDDYRSGCGFTRKMLCPSFGDQSVAETGILGCIASAYLFRGLFTSQTLEMHRDYGT